MTKTNRRLAGFTLDQTILVVAVIAILATIIISSVAWNVLNRANATKLNAHLTQINDAVGQYYQDHDFKWPANAAMLADYLTGYTVKGTNLLTPFGGSNESELSITDGNNSSSGGRQLGSTTSCGRGSGTNCYIYVEMTNVQVQEMEVANDSIDGDAEADSVDHSRGRLQWTDGNASERKTLKYWAVKLY
jgi:type II secretory pathway pseudopilin PulG